MNAVKLEDSLQSINGLDRLSFDKAQKRLDNLTKPLGSLGKLEDIVKQLAGINKNEFPVVDKKAIVIMCADNGVTDEGVSSCPKSVTASVTRNFTRGITGVNTLSRHSGADIVVVDIGVDDNIACNGVVNRKIRKGTSNMAREAAMSRQEAIQAIETGIDMVCELAKKGYNLLGTGEMGIGNTSTSSAVATVLTGSTVEEMVGRGAGLSNEGLKHKIEVIKKSIDINLPDPADPIDVVAKVGGFDIAGLAGCFIGAAACRIPILIDGFISAVAALVAVRLKPEVKAFLLPSHGSAEPGNKTVMAELGFEPFLNLDMRLGEGTGAALGFHIIDAAVAAYMNMGTFEDASITQYEPQE